MAAGVPQETTFAAADTANLRQQIQARIESLSYLPTTAAVAVKFVELGKNPDAEPADYARVVMADSSLSTKLLALANSSWAGVRQKVTTVKMAVNLLGLGAVRTLAISYCMTGLHNELRLSSEESEAFWEAALSKAVAARRLASLVDPKAADEAFVAGLFQDFALTVIYSVMREPYLALLRDTPRGVAGQLQSERDVFGIDHTEVGRSLAQKMGLPDLFVDTVAYHHAYERLTELVEAPAVRDATYVASLFPHMLNGWNRTDADACAEFLRVHAPATSMVDYVAGVQREFIELYSFFNEGKMPDGQLSELLAQTARAVADNTTMLVTRVNELLEEAASAGVMTGQQVQKLEDEASRDKLTGLLNRVGLADRSHGLLARAAREGIGFGVCYLDIDRFKTINDTQGHEGGDDVLKEVGARIAGNLPPDSLAARMGGDEFLLLLNCGARQDAVDAAQQILGAVAERAIDARGASVSVSLSAGLLYVKPSNQVQSLAALVSAADKLMYVAKRNGGGQVEVRAV